MLLATVVNASEFTDSWKPGEVEKLTYEIRTFQPSETTNDLELKITRTKDIQPVFVVEQTLNIPSQSIEMKSTEVYAGEKLQIVSSDNRLRFPLSTMKSLKVDTLIVKGKSDQGKFTISFNSKSVEGSVLPLDGPLTTAVGYRLVLRNMNFDIGEYFDYGFVNLLTLSSSISEAPKARDSVIGVQEIDTPAGKYQCYKVRNSVGGSETFNYYSTDTRHIPVKTEIIDSKSGKQSMTITLKKYN